MINSPKVAVAMSVYKADRFIFLQSAIKSLISQTYNDVTIYIAVDGYIELDVREYLNELNKRKNFIIIFNQENKGLATRLNQLIDLILSSDTFDFIARMDADDICMENRIEEQVNFFNSNDEISVIGSDVIEIDEDGVERFYKKMMSNHSNIVNNLIKKCPVNHPTVMFRVDVFKIRENRYKEELLNTQDYYLWVDLLSQNMKFANINKPLLHFRIDHLFHQRRGLMKAKNDFMARVYAMRKLNMFSISNIFNTFLLFGLRVSPAFLKKLAYRYLRN
jgi:glycosyltransferase involved in cell wall biosynthesis